MIDIIMKFSIVLELAIMAHRSKTDGENTSVFTNFFSTARPGYLIWTFTIQAIDLRNIRVWEAVYYKVNVNFWRQSNGKQNVGGWGHRLLVEIGRRDRTGSV